MNRWFPGILIILLVAAVIHPVSARTWHSTKGKKLEAELIRVDGDKAVLKRTKDGKVVEIELNRFVDEDRTFLEAQRDGGGAAPSQQTAAPRVRKAAPPSDEELITLGIILALINIPIYLLLGKVIFGNFHEFIECVRFWLTPDIVSWFRGEGFDDWVGEMKLGFFFLLCIAAVAGEFFLVARYVFNWI